MRTQAAASGNADAPRDLASAQGPSEAPADAREESAAPAPLETFAPPQTDSAAPSAASAAPEAAPAAPPAAPAAPTPTAIPPSYGATPPVEAGANPSQPAEPSPAAETARNGYRVQVTAIPQADVANQLARQLQQRLGMGVPVYVEFIKPLYKVRVGDFPTRAGTQALVDRLRGMGFQDAWTVRSPIRDDPR
jgi:septal ring-binding cell division protein DamX